MYVVWGKLWHIFKRTDFKKNTTKRQINNQITSAKMIKEEPPTDQ